MIDRPQRIVLVEDHPIMQQVIRETVEREPSLHVDATVGTAEEALELPAIGSADLVLIDVSLPRMNGIDLVRSLQSAYPGLRCLMLSGHLERRYVAHSLEAGARGYVAKDDTEELIEAILCALDGGVYISRAVR